jgi:tRNA(Leu) C34 or U34 (ribose-2'-O)-methylase TrmL
MITLRAAFVGIHGRGAWARSSGIALSGAVAQTAPGPDNPRALAGHSRRRRACLLGLATVAAVQILAPAAPPSAGGWGSYRPARSLRPESQACCRTFTLLQAVGDGWSVDEGEDVDDSSMTFDLADAVHGGTSGYPLPMGLPDDAPGEVSVWIRYFYQGGKLTRDGKLLRLRLCHSDLQEGIFKGEAVLDLLRTEGIDLEKVTPMAYQGPRGVLKGWVPLTSDSTLDLTQNGPNRVDVQLFRPPVADQSVEPQEDGFFTIGVLGGKTESNVGTLWRSAFQLDAAGIFVIGSRYAPDSTDVVKAVQKIPLIQYPDWNTFCAAAPYDAKWVAIEMGGEPLETFDHPARAVYILGSEDNGLPSSVVRACHCHVALPSINYASFNVAVAGSIVMYDRVLKQVWGGPKPKRLPGASTPSPWRRRRSEGAESETGGQGEGKVRGE